MPNPHGSFIWYELMTTDPDAGSAFYADVVGWSVADFGEASPGYRILSIGGAGVGGLMALPPGASEGGMRAGWYGYIGVDDVDATVASVAAAGGAVHMPATDLPGVGRMALVADPQGAVFYVMRGASEGTSEAFDLVRPGHCSWNELATSDQAAALAFYTAQFGWEKGDAMSMGAMGEYRFIHHAGERIGAMMTRAQPGPPAWTCYFRVADIDAAAARATAGGATILHGPAEVPGGDYIIVGSDPQGAPFALVGARPAG